MKKDKFTDVVGLADDKFIEEAQTFRPKNKNIKKIALAAASFILVAGILIKVVLPFLGKDALKYYGNDYYDVIKAFKDIDAKTIYDGTKGLLMEPKVEQVDADFADGAPVNEAEKDKAYTGDYRELTDNQVKGVIEGDLFKRAGDFVFYLDQRAIKTDGSSDCMLKVYYIDGEKSELVKEVPIGEDSDVTAGNSEIFLSKDCRTLTVISQCWSYRTIEKFIDENYTDGDTEYTTYKERIYVGEFVRMVSVDVSDPKSAAVTKEVTVTGYFNTARYSDGTILLIANYTPERTKIDYDLPETFVPVVSDGKVSKVMKPDSVYVPEDAESKNYTVFLLVGEDLEIKAEEALLSYYGEVFVSQDSIYATRMIYEEKIPYHYTEALRIAYGEDGFQVKDAAKFAGYIEDRYSMDEEDGYFRVFVTTMFSEGDRAYNGVNLYIFNAGTMEKVSEAVNFAPAGETVKSARFNGNTGYVCTSIENSDPVFFFDLSDPENPTYKATGTIAGFSRSLIDYGDGILLGVGEEDGNFKLETYAEKGEDVTPLSKYIVKGVYYSREYKSYFIDRENKLFGIAVTSYVDTNGGYMLTEYHLFGVKDGKIELIKQTKFGAGSNDLRSFAEDGFLYLFENASFLAEKI